MSELFDDIPDRTPPQRIWSAKIARNPVDFGDRVDVVIPGLDSTLRWQGCRWMTRNDIDMPTRGNDCLVVFDDNGEIWVVVWWPF